MKVVVALAHPHEDVARLLRNGHVDDDAEEGDGPQMAQVDGVAVPDADLRALRCLALVRRRPVGRHRCRRVIRPGGYFEASHALDRLLFLLLNAGISGVGGRRERAPVIDDLIVGGVSGGCLVSQLLLASQLMKSGQDADVEVFRDPVQRITPKATTNTASN